MAYLEPFLRQNGANTVRQARYLTNNLICCSETLNIFVTSVPCIPPSFGKLAFKIPDLEHFLRSYEIFGKVMCTGSAAQIFNCFQICLLPLFLLFGQTFICGGYYCLSDILVNNWIHGREDKMSPFGQYTARFFVCSGRFIGIFFCMYVVLLVQTHTISVFPNKHEIK